MLNSNYNLHSNRPTLAHFFKSLVGRQQHINHPLRLHKKDAANSPIINLNTKASLGVSNELEVMNPTFLGTNRYAYRVHSDAMVNSNILEGDTVICEKRHKINHDDIVVVTVDKQHSVLRSIQYNDNNTVTLLAANPKLTPMIYQRHRVKIQGVIIAVVRKA